MTPTIVKCSFCGYMPVSAVYWKTCPKCGTARPPNGSPYAGRGALVGLSIGALVGAACGYAAIGRGWEGLLAGAALGAIPGVLLMIFLRLAKVTAARISNKR